MSFLSVTGVSKSYAGRPVLRGVSLEVERGSLTAVLGLSGCGKTTLLRVIAGFERAENGMLELGGSELDGPRRFVAPERRGIGYVPQEGALFPQLTVAGNVAFALPRAERRGARPQELMRMVGIDQLADRLPHQISGGEQQRVAIARALANEPAVLLADEPTGNLDRRNSEVVAEIFHGLAEGGQTIVMVTHDQTLAHKARRIVTMEDGKVVGDAATLREENLATDGARMDTDQK